LKGGLVFVKRAISILIAFVIAMSSALTGFAVYAEEEKESKGINNFIDGIVELTHEYDKGKEFVTPEEDETAQIQAFSARNSEEVTDSTETEYTLQDFQTARLIIRADGNFDKCGALEDVSGFEDFHILQYESPEAAMDAYRQLQKEKNILEVDLDLVCSNCRYESDPDNPDIIQKDEFLNDWSRDRTQSKRLQEYLAKSNIPMKEVIVGVVDTGIDYNHEIFEGRVERTYFNASSSGNANDEMDSETIYHGTTVSSIVINNSPENVKVAVYKVSDSNDDLTVTTICAGLLKAIEKQSDIINVSLTSPNESLIQECVLKAYAENIPVFAPVGNHGMLDMALYPANISECIAVSATDFNNTTTFMNDLTLNSDISAPGEHIAVAIPGNRYARFSGTSYSSPYAATLGALLKSVTPEITVDEIDARLKGTSLDVKRYSETKSLQGAYMDNYHSLYDGIGMIQFANALGLEKIIAPELNLENKVYVGEQICTITCPNEKATVLYTTDGIYPTLENANIYTEPFEITQRTRIRTVAYYADGGYYSDEVEATPRIQHTDSDENFEIDNDGIIKRYTGNVLDLFVPETINGVTVTGFDKCAFNAVIGLILPKTVTEIPTGAFSKNSTIEFVCGKGIITVKSSAFSQSNIMNVEFPAAKHIQGNAFYLASKFCSGYFPNIETIDSGAFSYSKIISFYGPDVQEIGDGAFGQCSRLEKVYFPQCKIINEIWGGNGTFESCSRLTSADMPLITNLTANAFSGTSILKADFPFVETITQRAFYECDYLEYINMPLLLSVPKQAFSSYFPRNTEPRFFCLDSVTQIEQDAFGTYPTSRVEFSHLESAKSLPQTEECIISMPSTFRECTKDTKGRNYKVYGTKGTYAEQWANENGHTFIEVSQDTAVLTQLPEKYTDADSVLTADVIGFNRTYQWYANDTNDNTTGTPIPNATGKEFNPADYPAKYYYCVVTSTDVGYDPIEIRTNVTENTTYQSADYTEYNKAVEQAKALDRSLYTDLTELDEALSVNVSNLPVKDQALVDAQTAAIINAINSLVYKSADYTEYNKAVEQAKSLNRDDYLDFSKVDEALAVDMSNKNITEQAEVDAQTQAITDAINGLELKPVAPPVTNPTEPCDPVKPTEPTVAENSSVSADMQSPEIPKTAGDKLVCISAASLIPFAVCIFTLIRKKKEPD
jgi:hypothetical protein